MKDIRYLLSVNQEETGANIREAIEMSEYTDYEIATFIGVTERTIQYWKSGKRLPSLDNMVYLCALLDIEIRNLIVLNEDSEQINYKSKDVMMSIEQSSQYEDEDTFPIAYVLKKRFHIRTLEEFLLYYPLFDKEWLSDFFYRIDGSIATDSYYVYEKLEFLYNRIEDKKKRDEVDKYIEMHIRYPQVSRISYTTKVPLKVIKAQAYAKEMESAFSDFLNCLKNGYGR